MRFNGRRLQWVAISACVLGACVQVNEEDDDAESTSDAETMVIDEASSSSPDAATNDADATSPAAAACSGGDGDGDGLGNTCDGDDDGDGFNDDDDPAPLDANIPGNFGTPESILSDSRVKEALAVAKSKGVEIPALTELTPPNLSGLYLRPEGAGKFVATGDGTDLGRTFVGNESRLEVTADNVVFSAGVAFSAGKPTSFGLSRGETLRGKDSSYTIYSRSLGTCTINGSSFKIWSVGISSGTLDAQTGNRTNIRSLGVTIATEGTLTSACEQHYAGNAERTGGWSASTIPLLRKLKVEEVMYMCRDEGKVYAPTESWTRTDGKSCKCSDAYKVECS